MATDSPVYRYNPACRCVWCVIGDPASLVGHPDQGHGFGYDEPHIPPDSRAPWARESTR